jgi:hypothetical protein
MGLGGQIAYTAKPILASFAMGGQGGKLGGVGDILCFSCQAIFIGTQILAD